MMEWVRGATVGRGSFATVSLAVVQDHGDGKLPKLMAVKSAPLSRSSSLQHEEDILTRLQHCPYIIRCFGHELAALDSDEHSYNLFLEYASGGTLSDLVRRSGGSLSESTVRRFTRSLLEGIRSIHAEGYTHCDIKLQNILVQSDGDVRIADFGLAKKTGDKDVDDCFRLRGTPIYMSPESVARNEYETPADIWSLGCAVAEMASGKPAWRFSVDGDVWALLLRIGFGDELPEIPAELSDVGEDFLRRCFAKDPEKRWTAEMLLGHPFVADSRSFDDDDDAAADSALLPFVSCTAGTECCTPVRPSPKSILDCSQWVSPRSHSSSTCSAASLEFLTPFPDCCHAPPAERISDLATGQGRPDWSCFSSVGSWIDVRQVGFVSKSEDS